MYITPLRWSGGENKKKFSLLPKKGPRLPPLAALGWIIAYYVEFGKRGRAAATPGVPLIRPLRGHLPPWVGKALGTDCRVGALPLLAMTGRGIDKDLKAGIIVNRKRALPVDGVPPKCYMK